MVIFAAEKGNIIMEDKAANQAPWPAVDRVFQGTGQYVIVEGKISKNESAARKLLLS